MTYTLVGTGNMAHFLATRFSEAGFTCLGVYGRNIESVQEVATLAGTTNVGLLTDIKEQGDCCIVAVSDAALKEVAESLRFKETVLIHSAGSQPLDLLPAEHRGVMWCIYSILKNELPQHKNIPVVIDGNSERSIEILRLLAGAITDTIHEATFADRQHMHLAAVIGNNFNNHLMAICEAVCKEHNIPFSLFYPILHQTFVRITHASPAQLQTGPAKRRDNITMQRQTDQLQDHPDWQAVYKAISTSIENWYKMG